MDSRLSHEVDLAVSPLFSIQRLLRQVAFYGQTRWSCKLVDSLQKCWMIDSEKMAQLDWQEK